MCGRMYVAKATKENLRAWARRVTAGEEPGLARENSHSNFNVRPTDPLEVAQSQGLRLMRWGFVTDKSNSVFNARKESLGWPLWRDCLAKRRGVICVDGFYEWTGEKGAKQAHAIQRQDGEPMFMGVVWEEITDPRTGKQTDMFSIITTPANEWMTRLRNRMPLILDPEQARQWIDPATPLPEAKRLIAPYLGKLSEFECPPPKADVQPAEGRGNLFQD